MKTAYFTSLLLLLLCPFILSAQGAWTKKADYAGGNTNYAVGFSIGTKGYIGTGRDSSFNVTSHFWEYDAASDAWTQVADFGGGPRSGAAAFVIGSKGYVGTGKDQNDNFYNDLWEFDPAANTWMQKANFPGTPRMYAAGFAAGSYGYMGTGLTTLYSTSAQNDLWKYDPLTNAWTQISFPGVARGPGVGFSTGAKAYFGTGNDISDVPLNDLWEYDPAANTWTQKANLPAGKCGACSFAIGNTGYIGTGQGTASGPGGGNTTDFYAYDPLTNTWTQVASFGGSARRHAVAFAIGTKGYAGTGSGTKDFWEFDPSAVSVNEVKAVTHSIYPVPMKTYATFNMSVAGDYTFRLFNMLGREVQNMQVQGDRFRIERGQLSEGVYIYQVISKGQSAATGKLVIE